MEGSQHIRRPSGSGPRPSVGDSPGHSALCFRAHLGWRQGSGERVPEGHQPDGQGHAVSLPFDTPEHHCSGEWAHTSPSAPEPLTGQVRIPATCQTQGWRRTRENPGQRGAGPYEAPQSCGRPLPRQYSRDPGVGGTPALPGPSDCREQEGRSPDSRRMDARGYNLDRRLPFG